jgi:triphosphatase
LIQTVKRNAHGITGLHRRHAWKCHVNGPHPDLDTLGNESGFGKGWSKPLAVAGLADRLIPLFAAKFQRTIWLLRLAHGSEAELVLDQGEIQRDDMAIPISEIALQLKSGDVGELFDFALQLQQTIPLRIGSIGKFEREFEHDSALNAMQAPRIVKAAELELAPTVNVEQGFLSIVVNCLDQIQGNEAGVAHGNAPESVHQMRVGLHRLLYALGFFSDVVPCPFLLHDELKWLATELGAVRDWEVLAGDTLPEIIAAHSDRAELLPLQKACMQRARKNRRHLAAAINSVRYAHLMLSLRNWVHGSGWRMRSGNPMKKKLAQPLAKFAIQVLERRHKKLQKNSRLLRDTEKNPQANAQTSDAPRMQHKIRIAAKKNRYAIEFFESLFPAKPIRPYLKTLTAFQAVSGRMNDASVAMRLLHSLGKERADLSQAAGFSNGYLTIHRESDVCKLDKFCKRLVAVSLHSWLTKTS